jgi:NADP-reducing hydrogenase subunit HndB
MIKSLEELKRIRDEVKKATKVREGMKGTRIVVGMGTCGISAGAREVMSAVLDELRKRDIDDVVVTQTGCIGFCKYEPLMDVIKPGEEKVTYVNLTPEKARRVVVEHIVNGRVVKEYIVPNL